MYLFSSVWGPMAKFSVGHPGAADSRQGADIELVRCLATVLTILLASSALVLAGRRLAGAFDHPLNPAALAVAGGLLIGVAGAARTVRRDLPARILLSAAVLAVAAAVTLPGANGVSTAVFWTALAGEECWAWRGLLLLCRRPAVREEKVLQGAGQSGESPRETTGFGDELPSRVATPDADILQQLTLSRAEDGRQRLSGWLRMPLAAGQRTGNVHVAFCPPFAQAPEIEVRQLAGPACRLKTAQLLAYGTRVEVKLVAAAETAGSVLLEFSAEG